VAAYQGGEVVQGGARQRQAGGVDKAVSGSDFLLVNLFRPPLGAPEAMGELFQRLGRRAGLARRVGPHMARRAFGSNVADAGGTPDEVQALLGHRSPDSAGPYRFPDPGGYEQLSTGSRHRAQTRITALNSRISQLEQRNVDLAHALEERQADLDAARAANRDLTRALNQGT
jgi:integrase